jgi:exodeoxyribonuclease V beta subunit
MGAARVFGRGGFDAWGIQSYSGLVAGAAEEAPDRDAVELTAEAMDEGEEDEFSRLPRGTALGTCVHEVLENIDFTASPDSWADTVAGKLSAHRLDPALWSATVSRMVERVLTTKLPSPDGGFALESVPSARRINELEFFLPTKRFNVAALQRAFARHAAKLPVKDWPARVGDLGFRESDGFLHGYVDAVIEHGGRFYLLDWKTNRLGPNAGAYDAATVGRAMRGGFYVLQYHLYAVALRRFLGLRMKGVDFAAMWGGVFYSFLRGVDPAVPAQGWFFDRPDVALLDDLERALEQGGPS